METTMRSDKRKNPEKIQYRILTNDECRNLSNHCHILDKDGRIAEVKITSLKTWKTRPEFEVHCKFGMYEYFVITLSPEKQNTELVAIL